MCNSSDSVFPWAPRWLASGLAAGLLAGLSGCASLPSDEAAAAESTARADAPARESLTATEAAVAARRAAGGTPGSGTGPAGEMAKLVEQLNEAARELATLRTANARLRAERERARPAPEAPAAARPDPAEERLAASVKSYAQFRREVAEMASELDRLRKVQAGAGADAKAAQELARRSKADLERLANELRTEKRLRQEAEADLTRLREQLRAPAASGAAPKAAVIPSRHVVQAGDTWEKIAARFYGDSSRWRLIYEANRDRLRPDGTLEIGMELRLPRAP